MLMHSPLTGSDPVHRFHWYVYVMKDSPLHDPMLAVSDWPTTGELAPAGRLIVG